VTPETAITGGRPPARFVTTRWSVVLSCADGASTSQAARDALTQLCQTYWRPIFAFVCRHGYSVPDAQDLTQDFFVMLLEGRLLQHADPNRGRFRSLLLKALTDFLHDAKDKQNAQKRGGKVHFVPWDEWIAENPSQFSISVRECENWSAEKLFDVRWAATVVEHALSRLGEECEHRGRRRVFDVLSSCLAAEREDVSYSNFAKTLAVPETAVKRLVHQMRKRYRELLRQEVADTIENGEELEDELRYLCAALAASK
jgi:DNA-directed RNA polymerase specialized sigma24 family protein